MTLRPDHFYDGNGAEPCRACGKGLGSHEKHRWYKPGGWLHPRSIDLCDICGEPPESLRHNESRFLNGHEFVGGGGALGMNPDPPCNICGVRYSSHGPSDDRGVSVAGLVGGDVTDINSDPTKWGGSQTAKNVTSGPSLSQARRDRLARLGGKSGTEES